MTVDRPSPRSRWPWVLSAMAHLGVVLLVVLWVPVTPVPRTVSVLKLVSAPDTRPQEVVTEPPRSTPPTLAPQDHEPASVPSPGVTEAPLLSESTPSEPSEEAPSSPPGGTPTPPVADGSGDGAEPDYLPFSLVTQAPGLPVEELRARLRYPTAARRLGLEAQVGLELFIDHSGTIRQVVVLQDPGHGFAEAAVKAFEGLTCTPAEANGVAVAVRYRVPVRFRLDQRGG